jgi:protein-S-isoprenylcysteine O-methyltransferase Ste14
MNFVTRIIWLILNVFCGAPLANILFVWAACDMQLPLIITNFISTYLPIFNPLFNVPYLHINQLSSSISAKLIFNAFLYSIFGFAHTLFAQEFVQTILGRFLFPKQTLRTIYCIIVSVTTFIIIGFWQHTHIQLWNWLPSTMNVYQQQLAMLIVFSIIYTPGNCIFFHSYRYKTFFKGLYVVIKFNPLEFCGMTQIFNRTESIGCPYSSSMKSEKRTTGTQTLITSGLFRLCRHPLYLFTIMAWTITPVMSLDRLAFIIYTCIYATIAIPIEERKLIEIFGDAYINYQQHTPAIIPFSFLKTKQN